jgi:hypothetical protein
MGYDVYRSTMIIVECTWVSTAFQSPLLIIDRRGVSIMSGVFPTRRVAHLRYPYKYNLKYPYKYRVSHICDIFDTNTKTLFKDKENSTNRYNGISSPL